MGALDLRHSEWSVKLIVELKLGLVCLSFKYIFFPEYVFWSWSLGMA